MGQLRTDRQLDSKRWPSDGRRERLDAVPPFSSFNRASQRSEGTGSTEEAEASSRMGQLRTDRQLDPKRCPATAEENGWTPFRLRRWLRVKLCREARGPAALKRPRRHRARDHCGPIDGLIQSAGPATVEENGWTPFRLRRWLRVKLKIRQDTASRRDSSASVTGLPPHHSRLFLWWRPIRGCGPVSGKASQADSSWSTCVRFRYRIRGVCGT